MRDAMNRRGFTFAELLVAMAMMGIISTAIYQLLRNNQRIYREQAARIDLNQNVRAGVAIFPAELRELDAGDPNGGDIVAMSSSSITYNAMRNAYFLCQAPDSVNLRITLSASPWFGIQPLDVGTHLFLLFAENNPDTRMDDRWLHVNATQRTDGTACPGTVASITLTLTGATTAQLSGVTSGAPVRGYVVSRIRTYRDANRAYWIGAQTQNKATGAWSTIEPIVGPVTSTGLQFTYYDAAGAVAASTGSVARIAATVTARTQERVRARGGAQEYISDSLVAQIAVRNNPP